MLAGDEATGDIEIEGLVPLGFGQLDRSAHRRITDVVVQHIDTAVARHDIVDDRLDLVGTGNVTYCGSRRAALACDNADRFLCRVRVRIDTDDMRAFAREKCCRGLSVTPARPDRPGAKYDSDFVLQTAWHFQSCS